MLDIANSLYTCQYGTWLGNNQRERKQYVDCTISFWNTLDPAKYQNPFYDPSLALRLTKIPKTSYFELELWKDYYFQHSPYFHDSHHQLPPKRTELAQSQSLLSSFWYGGDADSQKSYLMQKSKAMY